MSVTIGTLEADEQVFLWLRREVVAGQEPSPTVTQEIAWSFDSA